jgi:dGTPase
VVVDGILTHTGEREPETHEGKIVRIVDRVAYINHDIDDAIRYGILEEGDLPRGDIDVLGTRGAQRIDTLVHDLIESSAAAGDIVQSEEIGAAMLRLREFMFERVYLAPETRPEHDRAHRTIELIYEHLAARGDSQDAIVEFIAGMTDRFALSYAERL